MRDEKTLWLIAFLLVATLVTAIVVYRGTQDATEPAATPAPAAEPVPAGEPRYPMPPPVPADKDRPGLRPLPSLDDSDEYLKLELVDLFGEASEELIAASGLVERVVATVDNLPRARVAEKIRPVTGLEEPFEPQAQDDSGQYLLDDSAHQRYDALVAQFQAADTDQVVALYRRYYPLLQKAYVGLGYPDGYFNDRLVDVIDHLLETPNVEGPVELVRPHVLYEFADPELEALSGGQKLMLRLGPDNRAEVSDKLRQLRERIVDN